MGLLDLTKDEIAKGVLCTPECISKLRSNNRAYKEYLATHLSYNTLSSFAKELSAYKYPTLTYKRTDGLEINIKNGANTMLRSIIIGRTEYIYKALVHDPNTGLICIITPNRSIEHAYAREDNELIIFRDGKEVAAIPSVSDELSLSVVEKKIYYVGEGIGSGYHRYDHLFSINYDGSNKRVIYKKTPQTSDDTIYLLDNYVVLWNYSDTAKIYRLDAGKLVKARDKYYRNGCILDKAPEDSLFYSAEGYDVHIIKGRILVRDVTSNEIFDALGGKIEHIEGPVCLIQPLDGQAYLYNMASKKQITKYTPDKRLLVQAEIYKVPIISVHNKRFTSPEKTLFVFYGAYGLRTSIIYPYHNWAPLVARGWKIVYIMARGGGDNGYKWEKAGRHSYHESTIKDVADSIKYYCDKYNLAWEKTAIYSRSAGGIPAGIVTLMRLVGISFMEHPLVDIVKTMGSPAFPLTETEIGEFGDSRVVDLRNVSPMDADIGDKKSKYPAPRVLVRTGFKDVQVYP